MPGEGGGSSRPGRSSNENWPNLLGFRGSSFTTGSQPVRVRKAEAFFTGLWETFCGEIVASSMILQHELRFRMCHQHSELQENFDSHTDCPVGFQKIG